MLQTIAKEIRVPRTAALAVEQKGRFIQAVPVLESRRQLLMRAQHHPSVRGGRCSLDDNARPRTFPGNGTASPASHSLFRASVSSRCLGWTLPPIAGFGAVSAALPMQTDCLAHNCEASARRNDAPQRLACTAPPTGAGPHASNTPLITIDRSRQGALSKNTLEANKRFLNNPIRAAQLRLVAAPGMT